MLRTFTLAVRKFYVRRLASGPFRLCSSVLTRRPILPQVFSNAGPKARGYERNGAWVTEYFEEGSRLRALAFWLNG